MTSRCNRCGDPATTSFAADLLSFTHGGQLPYCERCVIEEQLDYALERASQIDDLQRRLEALGGRAERLVCGYTYIVDGKEFMNIYCVLDKGHEGAHQR